MFSFFNRKAKPQSKERKRLSDFYDVLAQADKTYANMPVRLRMEIEKISLGLPEHGPRRLGRSGPGTEFFESRDYRAGLDDPRKINARLSARAGENKVVEKEAEIRQHFYLWRDASPSMEFNSQKKGFNKKQASEIMLIAFAKHLAKNEEMIGILDRKGAYKGGKASDLVAEHLADVSILSDDMPFVTRKLPRYSNAVLFSDFMGDPETVRNGLSHLQGIDLKGTLVMVLDPQEIDFNYKGHVEFEGMEGEGSLKFENAHAMKDEFLQSLREHIQTLQSIAQEKGFDFIIQRTDEPLHNTLYTLYGLQQQIPVKGLHPKR